MRVVLLGSGGREHALAAALAADPAVTELHAAPGNPGIGRLARLHPADLTDPEGLAGLAVELDADLVVIGPEVPLVAGAADAIRAKGIACFGPSRAAARLEGSKDFAKRVMASAGVPTARSRTCETADEVAAALDEFGAPYVVKDDGLAAGKGVVVTGDRDAALAHAAGCARVVVEEYLSGPEVSLFVVTDGEAAYPLLPAQDFKRIGDGDTGPNTGGMGSYSPVAIDVDEIVDTVHRPVLAELAARGAPFVGTLYAGLMVTEDGPKVLEFNCRFGDPETQSILPRLDGDLLAALAAAATGDVRDAELKVRDGAAVTVVLAAGEYPERGDSGSPIAGTEEAEGTGAFVFHGGTAMHGSRLVTNGGRILGVTACGASVAEARTRAYAACELISFAGMRYRRDIALETGLRAVH